MNREKEPLATSITPETTINEKYLISRETLVGRAAALKGLTLATKDEFYLSKEIGQIPFNEGFRSTLSNYGFEIVNRERDLFTISSTIKDKTRPELSDWWNIRRTSHLPFVLPGVQFEISDLKRGVLLRPNIQFSGEIVIPANQLSHDRMAEAIVSYYPGMPAILKEIVQNGCKVIVSWEDINVAGARTVAQLFKEWANENEPIKHLSYSSASPFNPSPERHFAIKDKDIPYSYLPEKLHGVLFAQWEKQLETFKRMFP